MVMCRGGESPLKACHSFVFIKPVSFDVHSQVGILWQLFRTMAAPLSYIKINNQRDEAMEASPFHNVFYLVMLTHPYCRACDGRTQ